MIGTLVRSKVRRRILGITLLSAALVVASPPTIGSANFASDSSGNCYYSLERECYADSSNHDWSAVLGTRMGNSTFDSLYNSYDTTDLTVTYNGTHTASVDIHFAYGDVPNPPGGLAVGLASCQDWSGNLCDHWHVIYDGDEIALFTDDQLKKLACHEIGHTVGLTHPSVNAHGQNPLDSSFFGCMVIGNGSDPYIRSHNVGHVNGSY